MVHELSLNYEKQQDLLIILIFKIFIVKLYTTAHLLAMCSIHAQLTCTVRRTQSGLKLHKMFPVLKL